MKKLHRNYCIVMLILEFERIGFLYPTKSSSDSDALSLCDAVSEALHELEKPHSNKESREGTVDKIKGSVGRPSKFHLVKDRIIEADYLIRSLQGFITKSYKTTKDKITRASPVSSQAEAGNIKVLQASWNEEFFRELENFPDGAHDDIVDSLSGAFNMLTESTYDIGAMTKI